VTKECLKRRGKFPVDRERLITLVMIGTRTDAQSFNKEVGIGSSSHCLFGRECSRWDTSVSDAGWKTDNDDRGGDGGESWVEGKISAGESVFGRSD